MNTPTQMKTTDNTTLADAIEYLKLELAEARQQRDALQTELGNTQFALEAVEEQRDQAVTALRDLLVQYKKGTCTIDTYYCRQAREAIAAAESEGQ